MHLVEDRAVITLLPRLAYCPEPYLEHSYCERLRFSCVKQGKDVDLYSASHEQDTSNAHIVTETEPPGMRSPHSLQTQACAVTQQPATSSASQQ